MDFEAIVVREIRRVIDMFDPPDTVLRWLVGEARVPLFNTKPLSLANIHVYGIAVILLAIHIPSAVAIPTIPALTGMPMTHLT